MSNPAQPSHGLTDTLNQITNESLKEGLSIGRLRDLLASKGFGVLLVFLSLPSALPIPAAGYSVPFGILLIILGIQLSMGKRLPWLPQRTLKWQIKGSILPKMLSGAQRFTHFMERWVRPRMRYFLKGPGRMLMGLLVVFMGVLMCIPLPGTNTAPAGVIFIIGVALTEEDGILAFIACVGGLLASLLYFGILYFAYVFIFVKGGNVEAFGSHLKEMINSLIP